jgi:hypothetical protein
VEGTHNLGSKEFEIRQAFGRSLYLYQDEITVAASMETKFEIR